LQTPNARDVCSRTISAKAPSPQLQRFGGVTLYFLPEKSQVFCRCRGSKGWETSSLHHEGADMLTDANACHITAGGLQLFAELHSVTEVQLPVPQMVHTTYSTVTSEGELESLREISRQQDIGKLIANISAHRMEADVCTLVKLKPLTSTHRGSSPWTTPLLITVAVVLVLLVLYQISHHYLRKFMLCCTRGKSLEAAVHTHTTPDQSSSVAVPEPLQSSPPVPEVDTPRQSTSAKNALHHETTL
jgi:hypothetical protein